jgi:hypothetical protein
MHFDDLVEDGPASFAMAPVEAKIDSSSRHEPHLNETSGSSSPSCLRRFQGVHPAAIMVNLPNERNGNGKDCMRAGRDTAQGQISISSNHSHAYL